MRSATTLATYGVGLVAVFALALGAGRITDVRAPQPDEAEAEHSMSADTESTNPESTHRKSSHAESSHGSKDVEGELPAGLQVSADGFTFELLGEAPAAGATTELSFRIVGPDGEPVTDYEPTHERELHLIAVRRDFAGYQHVHPSMDADGTWTVPVEFAEPGTYRLFADFRPAQRTEALTLGTDLTIAGTVAPVALPPPPDSVTVDGYEVSVDGELVPGTLSELTLSIRRNGEPITDLEPYLGAYGHLVALRGGDLAYLHVHPDGEPGDGRTRPGPAVTFFVEVPAAGDYRLFLDFQHDGVVRTAEFTMTANGSPTSDAPEKPHGHD